MKSTLSIVSVVITTLLLLCHSENKAQTEINWDSWGIPHIMAKTEDQLFYAQGWAQMKLHSNLILELYGKARGRGAEYWGKQYEEQAKLIHMLGFPRLAAEWKQKQDSRLVKLISAFVDGANEYARKNPSVIAKDNQAVLPITYDDVNLHYLNVIYGIFMASNDIDGAMRNVGAGSNAWAIGPSRSVSKNAMLVQNPHLPWWGEFTWVEMHLMTDDVNCYGATLVGFPGLPIAFNENLGWTHTVNTIDVVDTYQLDLKGDRYLLDGKDMDFEKSKATLRVKNDDGTIGEENIDILHSKHGPVIAKNETNAFAIRISGLDAMNGMLQWWRMATATSFDQFEEALKMQQIPYFNVMYADKQKNIFYLSNGLIPKRKQQSWEYWNRLIPGGKSEDIWTEVHPYNDLPKLKNPSTGWLQNTNDPPWSSTFPMKLQRKDFPGYMSPSGMGFRPQRSVRMLVEDESISFDELVSYKMSTKFELADRILDDLFIAIDKYGSASSKEAKDVLEKWDRQADENSKGAYLFQKWRMKMFAHKDLFSKPWSESDPRTTPDGLANPALAVKVLDEAVTEVRKEYGQLDVAWGTVYRLKSDAIDLPANGGDDFLGVFRVAWGGQDKRIMGGDSYVGIIEFGDKVSARVLLSYGNSSEKGSPHKGDQLRLFSEKKLRTAAFYKEDVLKAKVSTETLVAR